MNSENTNIIRCDGGSISIANSFKSLMFFFLLRRKQDIDNDGSNLMIY